MFGEQQQKAQSKNKAKPKKQSRQSEATPSNTNKAKIKQLEAMRVTSNPHTAGQAASSKKLPILRKSSAPAKLPGQMACPRKSQIF